MAIPRGYYGRIAPRSGWAASNGIDVLGGVIDASFRGGIRVILINHGSSTITFHRRQKIAQLIIEPCATPTAEWADELPETARGEGGFGSSDE